MTCNWIRLDYINSRFFHFSWKDIVWWSEHNPGSHDFLRYLKHYCQQHFGELVLCIIVVTNKRSLFCKTFLIRVLLRTNIWAFRGEKLIKFFTWCCIQNWKLNLKEWWKSVVCARSDCFYFEVEIRQFWNQAAKTEPAMNLVLRYNNNEVQEKELFPMLQFPLILKLARLIG